MLSHLATAGAILSAFFGLDGGLPVQSALICPPGPLLDGMPVVFAEELDERTIMPGDFRVITRSGARRAPLCATTAPANEEDEDRTVLLIGALGDEPGDPPATVVVQGSVRTESGAELQGATAPVIPLAAGPQPVRAEPAPAEDDRQTFTPLTPPVTLLAPASACPAGTVQRVRVTWDGGVSAPGDGADGDAQRLAYAVTMDDGRVLAPAALADLGDMDNNHLLCLDAGGTPVSVAVAAGRFADPGGDVNEPAALPVPTSQPVVSNLWAIR